MWKGGVLGQTIACNKVRDKQYIGWKCESYSSFLSLENPLWKSKQLNFVNRFENSIQLVVVTSYPNLVYEFLLFQ